MFNATETGNWLNWCWLALLAGGLALSLFPDNHAVFLFVGMPLIALIAFILQEAITFRDRARELELDIQQLVVMLTDYQKTTDEQ